MSSQTCPDKSTLSAFANGTLSSDERSDIARHVEECEACRAIVDSCHPSFLATMATLRHNATENMVPESLNALRLVPLRNREQLSPESRAIAEDFVQKLQTGTKTDAANHLSDHGISTDSREISAEHLLLLMELLCAELQQAWKQSDLSPHLAPSTEKPSPSDDEDRPTTIQYAQRFPILKTCPLLVADLAKYEATVRGFKVDDEPAKVTGHDGGIEQFDLIKPIASGGMGVVWKAVNRELGRTVAVKLIQQNKVVGNPERQLMYQQRFLVEAQAAARLTHPNIVQIHSIHNTAGQLYYEMDLIEGGNLRDLIQGNAIVSVSRAVELMKDIASAIDHAHRRGVIHRDLKPENILLKDGKSPMVTDFGLAKLVDSDTALTQDDTAMGTMGYMAPEQFRDAATVTISADIYSMGAMLYELLTGEVPIAYKGDITSFSDRVENFDPLPPQRSDRSVSRDIQNVCLKCLAKKPEQRYRSAADLMNDLIAFLEGRPVSARRVGPLEQFWRVCRRYPRTASLAGMLVAALLVGFLVSLKFMLDARQQAILALGAVNHFYLQIDQNDAFRQPAFNDLRVRLMQEGRERLKELTYAPVSSRDKSSQRAIATLHFVNGRSLQETQRSEEAFAEFQLAESIQRGLITEDPTDQDSRADLATTLVAMEQSNPQHPNVPTWQEEALSLRKQIAEDLSEHDFRKAKALRLLANVYMNKANRLARPIIQKHVEATSKDLEEAIRLFELASQQREMAAKLPQISSVDQGEKDALDRDRIVGKANLAVLLSQIREQSPAAIAELREAALLLANYLQTHPWDVEARRQLAECQLSKYLMAEVKNDAEFTAILEAERDADIVLAITPNDMNSRRTVARIALERALDMIVTDLDSAIESNATLFSPARLNAAAVEQLSRAFEHLPPDPDMDRKNARINNSEFLTAVRIANVLRTLTPLEGFLEPTDVESEDLRKRYLQQIQAAREQLYQSPAEATPVSINDFSEARIQALAYSAIVAHLKFETSKCHARAKACLALIQSRRQSGHESRANEQCESLVRQLLASTEVEQQP